VTINQSDVTLQSVQREEDALSAAAPWAVRRVTVLLPPELSTHELSAGA